MSNSSRRRSVVVAPLLLLVLILLLLTRCRCQVPVAESPSDTPPPHAAVPAPAASAPGAELPDEVRTPATVQAPAQVGAGAVFSVAWTGPDNEGDFLTIVRKDAPPGSSADYLETSVGSPLELTAPIQPGDYEVRYVTVRSRTILGRAPVVVAPAGATLNAPLEVGLGVSLSVEWTGPNNPGDFITLVPRETPDGQFGNYTATSDGSPLTVLVPAQPGEAELRYMTSQGYKVLGRRAIRITLPELSLSAAAEAIAGASLSVTWTGPNNSGDYITVVPHSTPDGQYGNYTYTSAGSPLAVLLPIHVGECELRYMAGQGAKVLARRPLTLVAPEVSLSAPAEAAAGSAVSVTWTGPNYPGDYISVVAREKPDNEYGDYAHTSEGSPLTVVAPKESGEAEVRYVAGQGYRVLARRAIKITP